MSLPRRALFAMLAILTWSCADPTNVQEETISSYQGETPHLLSTESGPPAVCGDLTTTRLIAGGNAPVGSVEVTQNGTNLYVVYRTDPARPIRRTALWVGSSANDIPSTRVGNPRIGKFPYKGRHRRTSEVVWEVPLGSIAGSVAVIAAFAKVGARSRGAWGEGELINPRGNRAMYFSHEVTACAGETVDPAGGTVTTTDGNASLIVAPGALSEPVDITIEPATLDDLLDHASGQPELELPTVFGVTPIAGTIWDFGPDGLEFLTPATVVLHYEESALPDGVSEDQLGAFIINGIFEPLPSTIDTDANTVTAVVEHFSFVFVAPPAPTVDLELTSLTSVPLVPTAGSPVDFRAGLRNNGPSAPVGGRVIYEASGSLLLGDVPASCSEIANPAFGDVAVSCQVSPLELDGTDEVVGIQIIPQAMGQTITVRATVRPAGTATDLTPDNDVQERVLTVGVEEVDLTVTNLALLPGSQPIVGGAMEFSAVVHNLGPGISNGGTLRYEALGQVVLDGFGGPCTEVADPGLAAAAIECDVPPLDVSEFEAIGLIQLTALVQGDITVRATVTPALGDTDGMGANNVVSLDVPIGTTFQVDLDPTQLIVSGPRVVGGTLDFETTVFNGGPHASNGGTLVYVVDGNVVVGELADMCTDVTNPGLAITVSCDFGPGQFTPVGALQVIPQADGNLTVTATVSPVEGDTDQNPDNDQEQTTVTIGQPGQVDLAAMNLRHSGTGPVPAGTPTHILLDVTNMGPAASNGGTAHYFLTGDVVLGELAGSCTATGALTVICDVSPLSVGETDTIESLQVIPQSEGSVSVLVRLTSAQGDFDPNAANSQATLAIPVGPAG